MLFAAICLDKPGHAELRRSTRAAHLAFLAEHVANVKLGGPFLDAAGINAIGSLLIIEAGDETAARALLAGDPYAKAGLFAQVQLRPWRRVVGAHL